MMFRRLASLSGGKETKENNEKKQSQAVPRTQSESQAKKSLKNVRQTTPTALMPQKENTDQKEREKKISANMSDVTGTKTVPVSGTSVDNSKQPTISTTGEIKMSEKNNQRSENTQSSEAVKRNLEVPMAPRRPGMPSLQAGGLMGFGQNPMNNTLNNPMNNQTQAQQMGNAQQQNPGLGHNSGLDLDPDAKKLVIGEGISISGDITACDYLVVEGSVKSDFKGSKRLDISNTGSFKGSARTEEAEIAGEFDGNLVVNGRLTIRSGAQIKGIIHYKDLAVETGSVIEGKLNFIQEGTTAKKTASNKPASSKKKKEDSSKIEPSKADKPAEKSADASNVTQMSLATGE